MKSMTLHAILLLAVTAVTAGAQEGDPLSQLLIPPQLIMEKGEEVGVTEEQRRTVQQAAERAHQQATEKKAPLEKAMQALATELSKDKIDVDAARTRLNEVLDAERAMKQVQLELLVGANNALTATQKKALQQMRRSAPANDAPGSRELEARLKGKLQRIQEAMKAKQEAGENPIAIPDMMSRFTPLMEQSRHREAEALLDEVLRRLGANDPSPQPGPSSRHKEAPDPPVVTQSPEEVDAEIAGMRVEEVAWRKIAWRTCLLDALRESHAENKPLLLWVFIDRPVDDKRC